MECAIGLRDDMQRYFALREADPAARRLRDLRTGMRVVVSGVFIQESDPKYATAGTIEVTPAAPELNPRFDIPLPDGDGAWTLAVVTTGGFTGLGRGDVIVTSAGGRACAPPRAVCGNRLSDADLQPLASLVARLITLQWPVSGTAGLCADCYRTIVTFRYRTKTGRCKPKPQPGTRRARAECPSNWCRRRKPHWRSRVRSAPLLIHFRNRGVRPAYRATRLDPMRVCAATRPAG
jgi:hypothetical protein